MYLKLGRLYLGLEKTTQGVKALKKVCVYIKYWQSLGYLAQQKSLEHKNIVRNFQQLPYTLLYVLFEYFLFCF